MLTKIYKIIFILLFIFYQNVSYSKKSDSTNFNQKNVYNYFSALISLENNQNVESLKFFNSSKYLKESHQSYLKKYLFSLILNGKIDKAIRELKTIQSKKFTDFFEAQLLLALDSLKKNDYKNSLIYINNLKRHKNEGTIEYIVSSILDDYIYVFNNNKIKSNSEKFGNLSLINRALQSCYLSKVDTESFFNNIIEFDEEGYSRYMFFYVNYLLSQNNLKKIEEISQIIDPLSSALLIAQTRKWIEEKKFKKIQKIFSCENSNDVIGEFLFVISNLYSSEEEFKKSNFYFYLSNYMNPKFKFNLSLLAENYFQIGDLNKSNEILENFDKKNMIYNWYKIKKKAETINIENNPDQSFEYIENEFSKFKNPSLKIIYDMGNIVKGFEKYNLSISYYSKALLKLDSESYLYADILFRRGGSYERIGNIKKSDEDLLKSLEINPDDPHVLNYLAYAWLERNYEIDSAIQMLEKAYEQRKNNPYIIDSIGWAYYLIGNYAKAEKTLKRAVEIMPDDPIVNDHYGDILWKLDRKIQAIYFWKNVLTLNDIEDEMKEEIFLKLLKGPKKI